MKKRSEELIEKQIATIRKALFKADFLVNDMMMGEYASAFKGQGLEFEEVREYEAGDDVRTIHWNVTARTGKPYVKRFQETRELSVLLLVDVSASMMFGSGDETRLERATAIAAFLAFSAVKSHDKVGLMLFSDKVDHYIPPKKGKAHIWKLVSELINVHERRQKNSSLSNLSSALEYAGKVIKRKTILFVISDFYSKQFEESLKLAKTAHDIIAVRLKEPMEEEIPKVGILELKDAETGEIFTVDTDSKAGRDALKKAYEKHEKKLQNTFHQLNIDVVELDREENIAKQFEFFFKKRERRRNRVGRCAR